MLFVPVKTEKRPFSSETLAYSKDLKSDMVHELADAKPGKEKKLPIFEIMLVPSVRMCCRRLEVLSIVLPFPLQYTIVHSDKNFGDYFYSNQMIV